MAMQAGEDMDVLLNSMTNYGDNLKQVSTQAATLGQHLAMCEQGARS